MSSSSGRFLGGYLRPVYLGRVRPQRYRIAGFFLLVLGLLHSRLGRAEVEVPITAQAGSPSIDGKPRITVRLVADVSTVTAGDTFHVGVLFTMDPGWHIYWINPGDAGFPAEVEWRAGDATFGLLQWPAPAVFRETDGITTYGYQNEALLFTTAVVSDSVGSSLEVGAEVRYLACNIICSPGQVSLKRAVPTGHQTLPADEASAEVFARFGRAVPGTAQGEGVHVNTKFSQTPLRPGDDFRAAVLVDACSPSKNSGGAPNCPTLSATVPMPFAPYPSAHLHLQATGVRPLPDMPGTLAVLLRGHVDAEADPSDLPAQLRGVLQLNREGAALRPFDIDIPLKVAGESSKTVPSDSPLFAASLSAPPPPEAATPSAAPGLSVWRALLLALVGGLVLNLMPCVLPVLAIKVIGATQVGQYQRREIIMHGVGYTAGVVLSMVALASVVIGLKLLGTQVGWGFQFQEPGFVAFVSCILVIFALNCFGVFEIGASDHGLGSAVMRAHGVRRSFLDGILAVVLATPCSAPFLGSAVAYALTQGAVVNVLVFVTIGLGLALPYVALTLTPGWVRLLPKPGPWMAHVKSLLGFGLLLTVVWLIWLIGRFAGVDAVARLLVFLLGVALVTWVYGVAGHRFPTHPFAVASGLAVLLFGIGWFSMMFQAEPPQAQSAESLPYRPYSTAAVLAELAAGRPAFVDFTADWCITCKFNEQHVLRDESVLQGFKKANVVAFRADWTRRDDGIRRILASFGRSGVPMYLLYSPNNPTGPQLLPEILTVGQITDALKGLTPAH